MREFSRKLNSRLGIASNHLNTASVASHTLSRLAALRLKENGGTVDRNAIVGDEEDAEEFEDLCASRVNQSMYTKACMEGKRITPFNLFTRVER